MKSLWRGFGSGIIFFGFLLFSSWGFAQESRPAEDATVAPTVPPAILNLSLSEAVEGALAHYEKVRLSASKVEEARGGKWQSYSLALPSLSGGYRYTRNIKKPQLFTTGGKVTIGFDNVHDISADLNQPVFGFGSIKHGILSARRAFDASVFADLQTKADVIFEVRDAYFQTLLGQERVKVARTTLDQALEILRREQIRYKVGEIPEFDFNRAELEVETKQSQLIQAEGDSLLALKRLKRIAGIAPEQEIRLTETMEQYARSLSEEEVWRKFEESNPTIKSLAKTAESAEHGRKAARGAFFPSINYFTSYQGEGQSSINFVPEESEFSHSVSLGVNVQVPIFDGLLTAGKYKSAEAKAAQAAWQKLLTEKDLHLALDQALTDARTNLKKKATDYRAWKLAETLYGQATLRYQNGLISFIDLKDVRNSLEESRMQYFVSLYNYVASLAKIEQIVGVALGEK